RESAKQSRRSDIPTIDDVLPLKTAARQASDAARLLLAQQERSTTLRLAVQEAIQNAGEEMPSIHLAVGPEGGWASEEEALFDAEGWRSVSLGPRILRAETAAITATAVVAALLE